MNHKTKQKVEREGVIQFTCQQTARLPDYPEALIQLANTWRSLMLKKGWIGQTPGRYQGLGFGNLSLGFSCPRYPHAFLITASQTGHLPVLPATYWTRVVDASLAENRVLAEGSYPPSSEAMSHAALYQARADIQAVIHIHSPELWEKAQHQGVACTAAEIPYGTPQMAEALAHQAQASSGLVVMLGHQDGLLAWGPNLEAAARLLASVAEAPG